MSATTHPLGTLPPASPYIQQGYNAFSTASEPHGSHHNPDSRIHGLYETGAHAGPFPPPPPPPIYGSPRSEGHPSSACAPHGVYAASSPHAAPAPALYVAAPKIEMQPWARNAWRWLVGNTMGVARVDLRRPTPPLPEQYGGNLLVVRSRESVTQQRDWGGAGGGGQRQRGQQADPVPAYISSSAFVQPYPAPLQSATVGAVPHAPLTGSPLLMGARIKITRSFIIGGGGGKAGDAEAESGAPGGGAGGGSGEAVAHDGAAQPVLSQTRPPTGGVPSRPSPLARSWADKPLLDIGVGVNLDVNQQQIQPVARIKVKDFLSIKAAPLGMLKISRSIPLGPLALKVRYELPLAHINHFWEPPARLMVRLDNAAGSGVHLTPGGLEFDEQVLQFGSTVNLRASASVLFPRQLPLEEGEPPLRLQLHRLSLRSIW